MRKIPKKGSLVGRAGIFCFPCSLPILWCRPPCTTPKWTLEKWIRILFFSLLLPPSCRRLRRAMWNRSVHTLRNTKACFFFPRGKYYAFCCCCYSFTWWDSAKGTFKAPWRFARYVRDSRSWVCSSASLRFVSFLSLLTHFPSRGLLQSYFICYSFPLLPCFTLHTDMFVVRARIYPKRREKNCLSARFTTVLSASGVFSSEGREMHLKKCRGIRLDGSIGAVSFSSKCFFFDFLTGERVFTPPRRVMRVTWASRRSGIKGTRPDGPFFLVCSTLEFFFYKMGK